jgi:hypothetical protein
MNFLRNLNLLIVLTLLLLFKVNCSPAAVVKDRENENPVPKKHAAAKDKFKAKLGKSIKTLGQVAMSTAENQIQKKI